MALEDDILALLAREPGLKGREIAARLGCDKRLANSTLTRLGRRHRVRQDAGYRWLPVVPNTQPIHADLGKGKQPRVDTPLARLCRYYLQCLSLDENGVSLFARDRYAPNYIELPDLPQLDPEERPMGGLPGVAELFRRLRHGASRKVPYVGYPVWLRHHRTQNWEGYFVEPVFLYEFGDDALQPGTEPDVRYSKRLFDGATRILSVRTPLFYPSMRFRLYCSSGDGRNPGSIQKEGHPQLPWHSGRGSKPGHTCSARWVFLRAQRIVSAWSRSGMKADRGF